MPDAEICGIMTSLTWNTNKWKELPTKEDLTKSKHQYVKKFKQTNDAYNFGFQNENIVDDDGYYWGFVPAFFSRKLDKGYSEKIKIIIFHSKSSYSEKQYIVGLYLSPIFFSTTSNILIPTFFSNVKVIPENIITLHIPFLDIDVTKILPIGKEMAHQGFNYLNNKNVHYLLNYIKETACTKENFEKISNWIFANIQENVD